MSTPASSDEVPEETPDADPGGSDRSAIADGGRARRSAQPRLRAARDWTRRFVERLTTDRVAGLSAELAFWTLLSLVPAAIMFVSMLGWLDTIVGADIAAKVERSVLSAMQLVFTDQADQLTTSVQSIFDGPNTALFSVAAVLTLWSGSRAFVTLGEALDVIDGTRDVRSWLARRLVGFAMGLITLLVAVLLMAAFVVGPLLGKGADAIGDPDTQRVARSVWDWLRFPLAVAALLAWATALYRYAPTHRTGWRRNVVGTIVAVVLWALFTFGFQLYIAAGGSNVIVSSLGGVLVALLWLYLMSIGVLVGAEVNRMRADRNADTAGVRSR